MEELKNKIYNSIKINSKKKKRELYQKDFLKGTYIISEPGYYILKENISFNPNCPEIYAKKNIIYNKDDNELDWIPTEVQFSDYYKHSSFILGFYSAINIESDNVILDLNGFTIEQQPLFSLKQRFFQIIQLNNSPFIMGQGPSRTFSNSGFKKTKNIIIKNGTLGRSSHYSIHGNENKNIILENLKCKDFESGSIALNNADNLIIENVSIEKSRRDVPVKATFSILRNTILAYQKCNQDSLKKIFFNKEETGFDLFKKLLKLERRMLNNYIMNEFKSIWNPNVDDDIEKEINKYFYNKSGLSDGSVLTGIQITQRGIAIHAFDKNPCCPHLQNNPDEDIEKYSSNVYLSNVKINDLLAKPEEVISCKYKDKTVTGIFGDTINMLNTINSGGKYKKTILNDCLFCMSKILNNTNEKIINTINIPNWMIEWCSNGNKLSDYNKKIKIMYGLDVMSHTNKGCLGIRLGGTRNILMKNVYIQNVINIGNKSLKNETFMEEKNKETAVTNIEEETGEDYAGILSVGIILSNCKNIIGENINTDRIFSKHKQHYDILYNDSENINYV